MKSYRLAWIALAGLVSACVGLGVGCGADDNNNPTASGGNGFCGNGIVEAGEDCDDGNTNPDDSCPNTCKLGGLCGNGVVDPGEECDDGNTNNADGCTSTCQQSNCNLNGTLDDGEECDDGNMVNDDGCSNACTEPRCGDGIVQAGEDCDDGNNELNDNCPNDCMNPTTSTASAGGDPCSGQAIYSGVVTNDQNPAQPGSGIGAVWSYAGQLGIAAGNEMCAAIGADHVCTYAEVIDADAAGELAGLDNEQEFWLHRVLTTVPKLGGPGMSPPGAGGRCNEWTYPTNHISDGEFGQYLPVAGPPANASRIGNIDYYFDDDTTYTGDQADPHECDGMPANSNPGCASSCGGATPKAILCCFPVCETP